MLGPISWILLSPLIGVVALLFVPKDNLKLLRSISIASVTSSLAFALAAFLLYDRAAGGYQFVDKVMWIPTFDISYHVGCDGINLVLLLLTAICSWAGVFVALRVGERVKEYLIFYLFLIVGCFGVLASLNVFFMYFFYECAVIPVFPLIGIWGSGDKQYAAMKLTLYLTLGAVLALLAILTIYWQSGIGTFNFVVLESVLSAKPLAFEVQKWAFPLVMVGFGVILTLWPLHTWSPLGYAAAPTSVSMLHAGVLKKLGAYLIIRLGITLLPLGARYWMPVVAWLAAINIVYCGLVAFKQKDLKYILGYSSCSHMGLILLGLATLSPLALTGTVLYMFAHGVMAALSFALVGWFYEQTHTRQLADWGGFGKKAPFISVLFVMASLASAGVPGFAPFIGEMLILFAAWDRYPLPTIAGIFGLVITAGYMLKTVRGSIQGPLSPAAAHVSDARGIERAPYLLLISALVIVGFLPVVLLGTISPSVDAVIKRVYAYPKVVFKQEVITHNES